MRVMRYLTFILVVGLVAGCAEPSSKGPGRYDAMQQSAEAFEARLDECIAIHGYDPNSPGDLGPNELAPTERAFSNCAYDGLRTTLMLNTSQPRLYDAIIAEHRTMTDKVASGLMTRSERAKRMLELREDLREKEIARVAEENQEDQISQGTMDLIRYSTFQATRF